MQGLTEYARTKFEKVSNKLFAFNFNADMSGGRCQVAIY